MTSLGNDTIKLYIFYLEIIILLERYSFSIKNIWNKWEFMVVIVIFILSIWWILLQTLG